MLSLKEGEGVFACVRAFVIQMIIRVHLKVHRPTNFCGIGVVTVLMSV